MVNITKKGKGNLVSEYSNVQRIQNSVKHSRTKQLKPTTAIFPPYDTWLGVSEWVEFNAPLDTIQERRAGLFDSTEHHLWSQNVKNGLKFRRTIPQHPKPQTKFAN